MRTFDRKKAAQPLSFKSALVEILVSLANHEIPLRSDS
jgi:hypothetical protein